jgi:hypothetical protein
MAMTSEGKVLYVLKLNGLGIAIDMQVDRIKARRILDIAMSESGDVHLDTGSPKARPDVGAVLSLREHLDQREATKKPEQILAIASYMLEIEGVEDVGREEIKSRFSMAREPLPANFPRDFGVVTRNGWLAPVHGKPDRYYITQSGVQALEGKFSARVRRTASSRKRSPKTVD